MLTEAELRRLIDMGLAHSKADQTEILVFDGDESLTRFANNEIHQNVSQRDATLLTRVVFGKRIGVASLNNASEEGVKQVIERASALAEHQVEDPDFQTLPGPQPGQKAGGYVEATAASTPEERAEAVGILVARAMESGLVAAGAFSTEAGQIAIGNSLGVFSHHTTTEARLSAVVMSDTSSGYADQVTSDVREVDSDAVARIAVEKALRGKEPQSIEPGEYEVVLDEPAVCDIVDFLAYLGFGALAVQEGRSFMAGHIGEKVLGDNITVWDDGLAADTIPFPFDFEGVPKQRVDLVTNGMAKGLVYDTNTALKDGVASTGHGLPAGSTFGPVPRNLFLAPGTASKEELIRSVKRGIFVTRFWYTRTVHPLSITVTGMTRDGTFLIENGEIVAPVRNLRFTQSYVEALNHVDLLGKDAKLQKDMFAYNRVPALKIAKWNFTGVTEY